MNGISVGDLFATLGLDLAEYSSGLTEAGRMTQKLGDQMSELGTNMSKAITLPLVALAGFSLTAFTGFEKSMNRVAALGDIVGASFEKLEAQALKLGAETQYSSKQASDAMGELAAAGFKAEEIFNSMPGVLALAATEGMKLADASKIAAGVMRAFGIDASQMNSVADILAKTAADSAVSITELGDSFKYIGPIAKALNLNLSDVSAALGQLANQGIRGETGGTAIRSMLQDITKPANKEASNILKQMKVDVEGIAAGHYTLGEIVKQVRPIMGNMSDAFQVFGVRASDVFALVSDGQNSFETFRKGLNDTTNAAENMRKVMNRGISGVWEQFTSELETLGIRIGKVLAPVAEYVLKTATQIGSWLEKLVTGFSEMPVPLQAIGLGFLSIAAAIGPVLLGLGTLTEMVGSSLKVLGDMGSKLAVVFFDTVPAAIESAKVSIAAMEISLSVGLAGAFLAVVGAVIAVGTAFDVLSTNSNAFSAILDGIAKQWEIDSQLFSSGAKKVGKDVKEGLDVGPLTKIWNSWFNQVQTGLLGILVPIQKIAFAMGQREWAKGLFTAIEDMTASLRKSSYNFDESANAMKEWGYQGKAIVNQANEIAKSYDMIGKAANDLASKTISTFRLDGKNQDPSTKANNIQALLAMQGQLTAAHQKLNAEVSRGQVSASASIKIDSELTSSYERLSAALRSLEPQAAKTASAMSNVPGKGASERMSRLQDTLVNLKDTIGTASKSYDAFKAKFEKSPKAVVAQNEQWEKSIQHVYNVYDQMGKSVPKQLQEQIGMIRGLIETNKIWAKELGLAQMYEEGLAMGQKFEDQQQRNAAKAMGFKDVYKETYYEPLADALVALDQFGENEARVRRGIRRLTGVDVGNMMTTDGGGNTYDIQKAELDSYIKFLKQKQQEGLASQMDVDRLTLASNRFLVEAQLNGFGTIRVELDKLGIDYQMVVDRMSGTASQQVAMMEDAYIKVRDAGVLTYEELYKAFVNLETAKYDLHKRTLDQMTLIGGGYFKWFEQSANVMGAQWGLVVLDMRKNFETTFSKGLQEAFMGLLTGNWDKAKEGFRTIGNAFANIWKDALDGVSGIFNDFTKNLSAEISKFVTQQIFGTLLGGFAKAASGIPVLGNAIAKTFGTMAASAANSSSDIAKLSQQLLTNGQAAAAATKSAADLGKSMAKSAEVFANSADKLQAASSKIGSSASSSISTLSKFADVLGIVTGAITAVMSVLQYLQGRRMEQDIGRIEVTTRGQLSQLISIQDTLNKYLPKLGEMQGMFGELLNGFRSGAFGGGGGNGGGLTDIEAQNIARRAAELDAARAEAYRSITTAGGVLTGAGASLTGAATAMGGIGQGINEAITTGLAGGNASSQWWNQGKEPSSQLSQPGTSTPAHWDGTTWKPGQDPQKPNRTPQYDRGQKPFEDLTSKEREAGNRRDAEAYLKWLRNNQNTPERTNPAFTINPITGGPPIEMGPQLVDDGKLARERLKLVEDLAKQFNLKMDDAVFQIMAKAREWGTTFTNAAHAMITGVNTTDAFKQWLASAQKAQQGAFVLRTLIRDAAGNLVQAAQEVERFAEAWIDTAGFLHKEGQIWATAETAARAAESYAREGLGRTFAAYDMGVQSAENLNSLGITIANSVDNFAQDIEMANQRVGMYSGFAVTGEQSIADYIIAQRLQLAELDKMTAELQKNQGKDTSAEMWRNPTTGMLEVKPIDPSSNPASPWVSGYDQRSMEFDASKFGNNTVNLNVEVTGDPQTAANQMVQYWRNSGVPI